MHHIHGRVHWVIRLKSYTKGGLWIHKYTTEISHVLLCGASWAAHTVGQKRSIASGLNFHRRCHVIYEAHVGGYWSLLSHPSWLWRSLEPADQPSQVVKCMAIPIRCTEDQVDLIRDGMGCLIGAFPCKYLGLPLTIRKLTAAQFQGIIDSMTK